MIEWTGEKWDDEYIKELMDGDSAYVNYLADWFAQKLEEENAKREEAGEEPYKEEDGTYEKIYHIIHVVHVVRVGILL